MADITFENAIKAMKIAKEQGDMDKARKMAALAKKLQGGQSTGNPNNSAIGQVNRGIANIFDAANAPVNFVTSRINDRFGTEIPKLSAQDAMRQFGIQTAEGEAEGVGQNLLRGTGEAAAAFIPTTKLLQAASGGKGMVASLADDAARGMTSVRGATAELAAGAGAKAAQGEAEGTIWEPIAPVLGGMAGVSATEAARMAGRAVSRFSPVANAARGVKAAVAPFTRSGGRIIAEDALKAATADVDRAVSRLEAPNIGNLTPAQRTGETGIMALERGVAARNPAMREALEEGVDRSRATLGAAAREGAQGRGVADVRAFFKERSAKHRDFLETLVEKATKRAESALRNTDPSGRPMDQSEAIRGKLDAAFDAASKRESTYWNRVPKSVEIQTANARQALADALAETTDVSADSIPAKARQFLGDDGFGETVTMDRLHRLYSEMRKNAREAVAQVVPDEFKARQANRIAEAILKDIDATDPGGAAKLLADARAYSREMNDVFGQDTVAGARAVMRSGGDRMREGVLLDATVGQGGRKGAIAVDDIRRAIKSDGDVNMTEYLKSVFQDKTVRGDRLDIRRADDFIRTNRELLDRFPDGLKPAIEGARSAAKTADRRGAQLDRALKYLGDRNAGGPIGFINARAGQEVAAGIFAAEKPAQAARALTRAAQRDRVGDAYLGLKGGVLDHLIKSATSGDKLRGDGLARELAKPEVAGVLREVLSPDEIRNLNVISSQLKKIDAWETVTPEIIENAPNAMVSTFLQMQAARAGRAMGTGTIQVPGMFVDRMRKLLGRVSIDRADSLIHDAMRDPELLASLLTGPGSQPKQIKKAESILSSWATGVLATEASDGSQ